MNYLVLLKRFEIWLLLAVVVGLIAFAFSPAPDPSESETAGTPVAENIKRDPAASDGAADPDLPPEAQPLIAVDGVMTEPSEGGEIIEVRLSARSETGEDVVLDESNLTATTESGLTLPRFFEPFREEPRISGEASRVRLRFWHASADDPSVAPGSLWIDFRGERIKATIPRNG